MRGRQRWAGLLLAALIVAAAVVPCAAAAASSPISTSTGRLSERRPVELGIWLPGGGIPDGAQPPQQTPRFQKPQRAAATVRNPGVFKRWRSRCAALRPRRRVLSRARSAEDDPG